MLCAIFPCLIQSHMKNSSLSPRSARQNMTLTPAQKSAARKKKEKIKIVLNLGDLHVVQFFLLVSRESVAVDGARIICSRSDREAGERIAMKKKRFLRCRQPREAIFPNKCNANLCSRFNKCAGLRWEDKKKSSRTKPKLHRAAFSSSPLRYPPSRGHLFHS